MSTHPGETAQDLTRRFFANLTEPVVLAQLFDVLPDAYLFIKDRQHRYMKVNASELRMHGCSSEEEIIGRTDFDFNPPALAAQYVEEDRKVMQSRRPLLNQLWLVLDAQGMPSWYLSSKFPLVGPQGTIVGIAGVMRRYDQGGDAPADYKRMTPACEFVLSRYAEPISAEDLARKVHLSVSHLNREFRRLFRMSPGEYIVRVRLMIARRKLEATKDRVGDIALDCGFYDQSHFTRAFQAATGLSPKAYRDRFTREITTGVGAVEPPAHQKRRRTDR